LRIAAHAWSSMSSHPHELKAHVENGRIVADEPVDLPDGTRLTVVVGSSDPREEIERSPEELTDKEREIQQAMPWIRFARASAPPPTPDENEQLDRSLQQAAQGDVVPHDQVVRELGFEEFSVAGTTKPDGR
jgi:hypothetical protein